MAAGYTVAADTRITTGIRNAFNAICAANRDTTCRELRERCTTYAHVGQATLAMNAGTQVPSSHLHLPSSPSSRGRWEVLHAPWQPRRVWRAWSASARTARTPTGAAKVLGPPRLATPSAPHNAAAAAQCDHTNPAHRVPPYTPGSKESGPFDIELQGSYRVTTAHAAPASGGPCTTGTGSGRCVGRALRRRSELWFHAQRGEHAPRVPPPAGHVGLFSLHLATRPLCAFAPWRGACCEMNRRVCEFIISRARAGLYDSGESAPRYMTKVHSASHQRPGSASLTYRIHARRASCPRSVLRRVPGGREPQDGVCRRKGIVHARCTLPLELDCSLALVQPP